MTRVAIVLGAAVRPDGTASAALWRRATKAADLYHAGQVELIIASGGVPRAGCCEAALIARICTDAGVPESQILIEDRSQNTLENIRNSYRLLPPDPRITLVTDRYHTLRARWMAQEFGLSTNSVSPRLPAAAAPRVIRGYIREAVALTVYATRRAQRAILRPSR
ncbi:YdcF family protein [uncultured Aliiroseovarius sp.]|uniref:YdcF family protein n=1 Tax=uncultured Aliiroseovarius sp. TaxID=1658783 RepID=UPI00259173C0|nr:YdcF family protein [uncultured Aliiroseovarius sp.]